MSGSNERLCMNNKVANVMLGHILARKVKSERPLRGRSRAVNAGTERVLYHYMDLPATVPMSIKHN